MHITIVRCQMRSKGSHCHMYSIGMSLKLIIHGGDHDLHPPCTPDCKMPALC